MTVARVKTGIAMFIEGTVRAKHMPGEPDRGDIELACDPQLAGRIMEIMQRNTAAYLLVMTIGGEVVRIGTCESILINPAPGGLKNVVQLLLSNAALPANDSSAYLALGRSRETQDFVVVTLVDPPGRGRFSVPDGFC